MNTRNVPGRTERPARQDDIPMPICGPTVQTMWEPPRLRLPYRSPQIVEVTLPLTVGRSVGQYVLVGSATAQTALLISTASQSQSKSHCH
jgi:hypothetical protein